MPSAAAPSDFNNGAIMGMFGSWSFAIGVVPTLAAATLILLFVWVKRSNAVLAGALLAWGTSWLILFGGAYRQCLESSGDCNEGAVPYLGVAGLLVMLGLGVRAALPVRRGE